MKNIILPLILLVTVSTANADIIRPSEATKWFRLVNMDAFKKYTFSFVTYSYVYDRGYRRSDSMINRMENNVDYRCSRSDQTKIIATDERGMQFISDQWVGGSGRSIGDEKNIYESFKIISLKKGVLKLEKMKNKQGKRSSFLPNTNATIFTLIMLCCIAFSALSVIYYSKGSFTIKKYMKSILCFLIVITSIPAFGQNAYVALTNDSLMHTRGIPNAITKPDHQQLIFSHKNGLGQEVYLHPKDHMPIIRPDSAFVYTMPGSFPFDKRRESKKPLGKLPTPEQLDSMRKKIVPKKL